MPKMNSKGRMKGELSHVRHYHWMLNSPAWRSLSLKARVLEMELKALYNGMNNGQLFMSVREAANRLGVATNTASKAIEELQEKGFIRPNQKGHFDWKKCPATSWILTEFAFNGALATKDFMRWKEKKSVSIIETDSS